MNEPRKPAPHLHLDLNEYRDEEYCRCCTCGEKTVLITAYNEWRVDSEAYQGGDYTADDNEVPETVEVDEEITAHYCLKCEKITSISFNQV